MHSLTGYSVITAINVSTVWVQWTDGVLIVFKIRLKIGQKLLND